MYSREADKNISRMWLEGKSDGIHDGVEETPIWSASGAKLLSANSYVPRYIGNTLEMFMRCIGRDM